MTGYTARDVARMLDLSVEQVRSYARSGVIQPRRGPRGEYRFSFQDLVLLRTAKGLQEADIPPRAIKRSLMKLKDQLPSGRSLTGVRISAMGDRIVVRDDRTVWNPESGQTFFDFDVSELAEVTAPIVRETAREALGSDSELSVEEWFELACELESSDPESARDAYSRVIAIDPRHADAHVNLGRLLHEAGQPGLAEAHYRLALASHPGHATAWFNLGVSLEDLDRPGEAIIAYGKAAEADPGCADVYYNLARLHEKQGDAAQALRYLTKYRRLLQQ